MNNSHKEFLTYFGWNDFFENQLAEFYSLNTGINPDKLRPARIINEEKNLYRLQFGLKEILWSSVTGKMQFSALSRRDFPAIGDWVLAEIPEQSDRAIIRHIFKRKTTLVRKQVGGTSDVQILSTNIDTVFIATSLNGDLNIGRLERYLAIAWDSGAKPIILLTKSDLYESGLEDLVQELGEKFNVVDIYTLSKDNFEEATFLKDYFSIGTTSVIVGSSGVGKSTISNFLVGSENILTKAVREFDGKGRHTTTSRSLYQSIYGGLIIDTPGMRELQFAGQNDGAETQFLDIDELVVSCRYRNCKHETEKDCAIIKALETGQLDDLRWKRYKKIISEVRHSQRKENKWMLMADRKVWKKRSMEARAKNKGWR
jgi:ribosome biogenesis GTPase